MQPEPITSDAELIRFELGESMLVPAVAPVETAALEQLGPRFAATYDFARDLRYLNAVLKMIDREEFQRQQPAAHRRLSDWANAAVETLKVSRGLR